MSKPKISLVIPAYNEESCIANCLDSAIKNSRGGFAEIIVVDNGSNDKTGEIAKSFPGVKVVKEEKKGLTRARERGLRESTGDLIAYIDADTKLPEKWFSTAENFFQKEPEAVSLSGPYKYHDGPLILKLTLHALWWCSAPVTYFLTGYMILGGNFVAKKEALVAAGGFDENIAFYGEDTDIARRLRKHGRVVFKMDFFIYSSNRRFRGEGLVKISTRYALNFIWQVVFHRPFTKKYQDIRL